MQVLRRMEERPDDDFTALEFSGSLEAYVGTLDAAAAAATAMAGGACAMAVDESDDDILHTNHAATTRATPATAKVQKKKAAAAKSKPAAAIGIQKGSRQIAVRLLLLSTLKQLARGSVYFQQSHACFQRPLQASKLLPRGPTLSPCCRETKSPPPPL